MKNSTTKFVKLFFSLALFFVISAANADSKILKEVIKKLENRELKNSAINSRQRICFDDNWLFSLGDKNNKPLSDLSKWQKVTLPHDWSMEGEYVEDAPRSANGSRPTGFGYYQKDFTIDNCYKGKKIEIQFDGIYRHATVYLNDKEIGTQYDGYISFYFDISDKLNYGGKNTLRVEVDNTIQPNCRWYSGSGIHRHVWLTVKDKLNIVNWGTAVVTPNVTEDNAEVIITTSIENGAKAGKFTLKSTMFDNEGKEVASFQKEELMGANCNFDIRHYLELSDFKLWSVDSPYMYSIKSEVIKDGKTIDSVTTPCGIRTLEFNATKGFFLNGENMKMKGVCVHHSGGTFGAAVPEAKWERYLLSLKEMGCNAIRMAHNPPTTELLDLCDRMGFLVMDEFVDKWDCYHKKDWYIAWAADPYFRTEWQKNFRETIRRDRNHPSIIMWSTGNETNEFGDKDDNRLLDEYCSYVRTIDTSRPVIAGTPRAQDRAEVETIIDDIFETTKYTDLMGMNYCEQWLHRMARREIIKPFVSTESYTYFSDADRKRHATIERSPWIDVLKHDFDMGLFVWSGIEYLGESKWPSIASNSGLIDINGNFKENSYLYQAFWSDKPMVRVMAYEKDAKDFSGLRNWSWPPVSHSWNRIEGDTVDVVTYTNCEEVDLYLNDKKIGTQRLADFPNQIMVWNNINYKAGELKAIGKNGGVKVTEFAIETTSKPTAIVIKSSEDGISNNNQYIFIDASIVDSEGRRVWESTNPLNFSVVGGGEIVSLSNANPNDHKSPKEMNDSNAYKGACHCVIKVSDKNKPITLKVSGKNLKSSTLKLSAVN